MGSPDMGVRLNTYQALHLTAQSRRILALSAVAALTLYVGGYFLVVHRRLRNSFYQLADKETITNGRVLSHKQFEGLL